MYAHTYDIALHVYVHNYVHDTTCTYITYACT